MNRVWQQLNLPERPNFKVLKIFRALRATFAIQIASNCQSTNVKRSQKYLLEMTPGLSWLIGVNIQRRQRRQRRRRR